MIILPWLFFINSILKIDKDDVNDKLLAIYRDRTNVDDMRYYTKVGRPYRMRTRLQQLASDAERASQLMDNPLRKVLEAYKRLQEAGGEFIGEVTDKPVNFQVDAETEA